MSTFHSERKPKSLQWLTGSHRVSPVPHLNLPMPLSLQTSSPSLLLAHFTRAMLTLYKAGTSLAQTNESFILAQWPSNFREHQKPLEGMAGPHQIFWWTWKCKFLTSSQIMNVRSGWAPHFKNPAVAVLSACSLSMCIFLTYSFTSFKPLLKCDLLNET